MLRVTLAFALLSSWLLLLLVGWDLAGGAYLLLLAAVVFFPWRLLGEGERPASAEESEPKSP